MRLFDSNLIIYSASDQYEQIRLLIAEPDAAVSTITKGEALGIISCLKMTETIL